MPVIRMISVNGSAGAFVDIFASIPCKYCEGREDESGTTTGLDYKTLEDGFATTYDVAVPGTPDTPQIRIPAIPSELSHGKGAVLGYPAQSGLLNRAADRLLSVRSKTASTTKFRFKEQE